MWENIYDYFNFINIIPDNKEIKNDSIKNKEEKK